MNNFYPKKLFLLLVALLYIITVQASYLRNVPQKLVQPNGTIVNCFATGDEFYHWLHDEEGYTIVQNSQTGYFCYAILKGDELVSSENIVGETSPSQLGLTPWINIPAKKMGEIREKFLGMEKAYLMQKSGSFKGPQKVNTTGALNNVVIYIRFSGESEYTTNQSVYTEKFNSTTSGVLSQHNYFNEVSYGTLNMTTHFLPANTGATVISFQDSHPRAYYKIYNATTNPQGYNGSDERTEREHALLQAAVTSVDEQLDDGVNIDNDGDGYVDNVCFIVQGSSEGWSDLLWPHKWSLYTKNAFINTKQVNVYNFQLQNDLDVSVLCHEMFHTLGAPDLYHYTDGTPDPVGKWDLMNMNLPTPQHMTQFMKYRYGHWIDEIPEITASGDYTLNPVTTKTNSCWKIKSPYSTTEYFVVEYRKKEKTDIELPNEGLLVYRINAAVDGQGNRNGPPDELYIYRPDGSVDKEGSLNNATFSADLEKTSFSDKTNPDPFLSNGNIGGLNISKISSIGATMSFHVDIFTPLNVDIAATKIITPANGSSLNSAEKIKVNISGLGLNSVASGGKINYRINGGTIVTEDITGTLEYGKSIQHEFATPADFLNPGLYTIKVYTTLTGDENTANDTVTATIFNPTSLDYLASHASILAGTYTELTAGTAISVDQPKDGLSSPVTFPDGFTFQFSGTTFSQFVLSTNGFIKLGDQNPSSKSLYFTGPQTAEGGIFNSANEADTNIIAPFNHDLVPGDGGAEYRVDISGTAPNRVVTIQFKNVRDNDAILPNQYTSMNFQIKLYETSNVIDFVYGAWTASTNSSYFKTSLCGLRGLGNNPNQLLAINKGSGTPWDQVTFANGNYSTTATLNFGNGSRPAPSAGFTIRLSPKLLNDINVKEIYTMGQLPINLSTPHTITALVVNDGTTTKTNVNVTLSISGVNTFSPSAVVIPSIRPRENIFVNFEAFSPTKLGANTIAVSIPADDFNSNNTKSINQNITAAKFCYSRPSTEPENAFTIPSTKAFVKFHMNGSAKIGSVEVMIYNSSALIGQTTTAYVLNANGEVIGNSSLFTVTEAHLGSWVAIPITTKPIITNSDYYVGLDLSNGYFAPVQTENPTRTGTFFKSSGNGILTEFGNNLRLMYAANAILSQTITFNPLPAKVNGDADFDPGATTTSSLAISYTSSNTSVATIVNKKIHITGVGTSEITASQAGNSIYTPATSVTQTLTVTSKTGINPNDINAIKIFSDATNLFVEIPVISETSQLSVYNILGNQVYKTTNLSQGLNRIEGNFTSGTYIVKVMVGNKVITEKVVLNK